MISLAPEARTLLLFLLWLFTKSLPTGSRGCFPRIREGVEGERRWGGSQGWAALVLAPPPVQNQGEEKLNLIGVLTEAANLHILSISIPLPWLLSSVTVDFLTVPRPGRKINLFGVFWLV